MRDDLPGVTALGTHEQRSQHVRDRPLAGRRVEYSEYDLARAAFMASKKALKAVKEKLGCEGETGLREMSPSWAHLSVTLSWANRAYQDEHCIEDRWTSTDAYDSHGDMIVRLPPCKCSTCVSLKSVHRFPNQLADNGAVFPDDDS